MGLAASQARLLLLTGRKNDVESQIMSISNEKLSLSRQSAKLSEEYSNALNVKKMVWNDGSSSVDLTYGLFMNPNEVDGQYIVMDSSYNSVVLNDALCGKLGLGTSGSGMDFLSKYSSASSFVVACMGVSGSAATSITTETNQIIAAGTSTDTSDIEFTTNYKDADVFEYLADTNNGLCPYSYQLGNEENGMMAISYSSTGAPTIAQVAVVSDGSATSNAYIQLCASAIKSYTDSVASDAATAVLALLSETNAFSSSALEALSEAADKAIQDTISFYGNNYVNGNYFDYKGKNTNNQESTDAAKDHNGVVIDSYGSDELYVDVSQMVKTFLAYFDAECAKANGNSASTYTNQINNGSSVTSTKTTSTSTGVTKVGDTYTPIYSTTYTPVTVTSIGVTNRRTTSGTGSTNSEQTQVDAEVNRASDDLNNNDLGDTYEVKYYINLFNALKKYGWRQNSNIDNSKYFQNQMIYGNVSVMKLNTDGTWGIVSTNSVYSPLETVSDDEGNDQAEAEYEAAKDQLDYKESKLDIKMNDLDTERSAIETEVESVQKLINKNIEGSFKLFQNA